MRTYLVSVIALLALALTPLGLAVDAPSTGGTGPSGAAAPGTSAASARCSKAAATPIVKRLHLGAADFLPNPVSEVFCGAFMGLGSRTMVVVLASDGASVPILGWAVFRPAGGAWKLVMVRYGGARITPAGSDIRETVSVMREGDSHCCPSGGTRARLWHWNGTRLVAGPWKLKPAYQDGYFKTPSGNIVCYHFVRFSPSKEASVGCGIKSGLVPAPPRRPCQEGGYAGDRVYLNGTGRVGVPTCAGDPGALVGESRARVLGYGKTWSGGGIRCTSAVAGLTCRNKSGHGFFLSREHWRSF